MDGAPAPERAAYIAAEGLDFGMASPGRYREAMERAGFGRIEVTSRNEWYRQQARDELARLFAEIANDKTPGHKTDTFQKIMGRPGRSLREYLATVA